MTRKDYVMIAKHLNDLYQDVIINGQDVDFGRFISRFCCSLKEDNPEFDSAKFRTAVYRR